MTKEELEDEYCQAESCLYKSYEEFLVDLVITYDKKIEELEKINEVKEWMK